ncbi:TFIIB-type zinc ribbon-containing protein [Trichlorobacter ammonificans]|uniref:Zf-TFIIB domain-containing protein n=1 Tax=Trichlorobacter ammonificans TaxID=2916410 RepID=A0ABM9D7S2_9BACT|nr:zf-TFIIB domain-containing protein [Trichlorobacter ammonificans]CAH2030536.1 zf-TFIIB domain-containing protein [Trichlorobacter ammonificans]
MNCPVCPETPLVMSERQGVEIDYCPRCRGVWLDRGELDKIIERSASSEASAESTYRPQAAPQRSEQLRQPPQHQGYGHGHHHKKRKSFLSDIFDFD